MGRLTVFFNGTASGYLVQYSIFVRIYRCLALVLSSGPTRSIPIHSAGPLRVEESGMLCISCVQPYSGTEDMSEACPPYLHSLKARRTYTEFGWLSSFCLSIHPGVRSVLFTVLLLDNLWAGSVNLLLHLSCLSLYQSVEQILHFEVVFFTHLGLFHDCCHGRVILLNSFEICCSSTQGMLFAWLSGIVLSLPSHFASS